MGVIEILTIIFVVLKLGKIGDFANWVIIDWPWNWSCLCLELWAILFYILLFLFLCVLSLLGLRSSNKNIKNKIKQMELAGPTAEAGILRKAYKIKD